MMMIECYYTRIASSRSFLISLRAPISSHVTSGTVAKPSLLADGCTLVKAICQSSWGVNNNVDDDADDGNSDDANNGDTDDESGANDSGDDSDGDDIDNIYTNNKIFVGYIQ